jgi:2-methylcitrate dehydratase PrpD
LHTAGIVSNAKNMSDRPTVTAAFGEFIAKAAPPTAARARAAAAVLDTVGVTLAGVSEPGSLIARQVIVAEGGDACAVFGTMDRASMSGAALANGTAAHALDYDDMCFVSLAHPSAPLVPAALAAGEAQGVSGRRVLDAYVVGFEIEARLGRLMNPRHYQRGWHCTSTLGTIGSAAAVSRLLGLDAAAAGHALAIAASQASGLKENFGTMVKPLHAGLAARNGALAALLARAGMTASELALDGPQGFLHAMDSEGTELANAIEDLGTRWEILDTGITVKLYPSCAGTHPSLDAILDLRRRKKFTADDVERVDIDVDSIVPTILIYDRPATGLEGKFSLPFCAAAAVAFGRVGIDTFDADTLTNPQVMRLMSGVDMRVDPALDLGAAPLTHARVHITLRDGRVLTQGGARRKGLSRTAGQRCRTRCEILGLRAPDADGGRGRTRARAPEKHRRNRGCQVVDGCARVARPSAIVGAPEGDRNATDAPRRHPQALHDSFRRPRPRCHARAGRAVGADAGSGDAAHHPRNGDRRAEARRDRGNRGRTPGDGQWRQPEPLPLRSRPRARDSERRLAAVSFQRGRSGHRRR